MTVWGSWMLCVPLVMYNNTYNVPRLMSILVLGTPPRLACTLEYCVPSEVEQRRDTGVQGTTHHHNMKLLPPPFPVPSPLTHSLPSQSLPLSRPPSLPDPFLSHHLPSQSLPDPFLSHTHPPFPIPSPLTHSLPSQSLPLSHPPSFPDPFLSHPLLFFPPLLSPALIWRICDQPG